MERQPDMDDCPGGPPRLPPDAERLGLSPVVGQDIQFAASLASGRINRPIMQVALGILGFVVLLIAVLIIIQM